ncbi:MAG TPA: type I-D CRISPR-associated protein Cas10d/Csc3, partial [Phototrophicaceae bacterium]|nr:type I-D CRISPR-associated protein Cas10d/Csc3 [Phototrophicaceae bacterium]
MTDWIDDELAPGEYRPDAEYVDDTVSEPARPVPASIPLFQTLLEQAIITEWPDDAVLLDFAHYVAGPISDYLGATAAKGGDFARRKQAEGADTERYRYDQSLRAHLVNGLLPTMRVLRLLRVWGAPRLAAWTPEVERLAAAGFVLHDYIKLPGVKVELTTAGFGEQDPPSQRTLPILENIFRDWCERLGLNHFLAPLGGVEACLQPLIYIAANTQQLWGTALPRVLFPRLPADMTALDLSREFSHLADLLAYVAPNPRRLVAHGSIQKAIRELATNIDDPGTPVARLTYHHVAENRGLLLNFIHDGALAALSVPSQREPLLYAPSGVVYLERSDAPPLPQSAALVSHIIDQIRHRCGRRLLETGKGAKRGNVSLQTSEIYDDFFDLRDYIRYSRRIVSRYVKSGKAFDRLTLAQTKGIPVTPAMPGISSDPTDPRVDQLAEWAGLLESVLENKLAGYDFAGWLLARLGLEDLRPELSALRHHPQVSRTGGVRFWWFWLMAHLLHRHPGHSPDYWLEQIESWSMELADVLPSDLPVAAQINTATWDDLQHYLAQVFTVGDTRAVAATQSD